jgi:uncharacterized protein (TIGR03089 family)
VHRLTGGLVADRDPAAPLLTLYDGPARVELSGATTENWVCKTANLLRDGYGGPARVGLLLPLHWQVVCFLLGTVAGGATAVVARTPEDLAGCDLAFVHADHASAALDAGVEDVLACSGHPLGARLPQVPTMALDAAVEVPTYGDRYPGPYPTDPVVELGGQAFAVPDLGLGPSDRVLTTLPPGTPEGLGVLLSALAAGAGLVLAVGEVDLVAVAATERVTAAAGPPVQGTRPLE